ncbi:MAG: hypothetical protein R2911_05485 [Caldilineaceae bacterium]
MATVSTSSLWQRPRTPLGHWSVRLAVLFVGLFIINSAVFMPLGQNPANEAWMHRYLPYYSIFMILCGLASGIVGLAAVMREHERSWPVWLTILPFAFILFLLLGEFLIPH